MRRGLHSRMTLFILTALLVGGLVAPSFAQEDTGGIRFGAFSIRPSLYTALRYNDNIYFVPDDYRPETKRSIPQSIEGDMVLNVVPEVLFDVTVPSFRTYVGYRFYNDSYLGMDDPDNRHDDLNASNHTFRGLLDYDAPFGLMFGGSDDYSLMQTYEETDQFVDYLRGEQIHNDARGWLGYRFGTYDNIYFKATYINLIDEFERYAEYNKISHFGDGELRLKFFPRTALILQGGYGWIDYDQIQAFDSSNWYGLGGLQGQISSHLLLTLKGGWQQADYQENDDFEGYLAHGDITTLFASETRWSLGYRHYFRDAADTNFYSGHEGYTRFSRLWASRWLTTLFFSYQLNDFSQPNERQEDFIQGSVDLTYRFVYWMYIGAGYLYENRVYDNDLIKQTSSRNTGILHLKAIF